MQLKIFDSELKVMEVLWEKGELSAGQMVKILRERTGWNPNTTYTVIKKLVEKGAVRRSEPGFMCKALVGKDEVRQYEAEELMGKLFNGSAEVFLSAFLSGKKLSSEEISRLKKLTESLE